MCRIVGTAEKEGTTDINGRLNKEKKIKEAPSLKCVLRTAIPKQQHRRFR